MFTRREFIGRSGAAAVATAGLAALSGPAAAVRDDHQPDHVTISYDQARLERYRPRFQIKVEDREKLIGLYGWIAESPEYETDVYVYWMKYTHQESPWWGPTTGHYGDHEPIAVEVDKGTGDVTRLRASIFHWIKGEVTADVAPLSDDGHPRLRVFNPYHHYTAADPEASLDTFEVEDLTGEFRSWLDNGLEESLVDGACVNPWIMRSEEDWWRPGSFGLPSTEAMQANLARDASFGVAGKLSSQ